MDRVSSRDGTSIAFDRTGDGPAVVLVTGALDDGSENAGLAAELGGRFAVHNYARRGRGNSGDTPPYALERELEDLEAVIGAAGGSAHVYGLSSGGALALEAAAAGLAIESLALYEVPYFVDDDMLGRWRAYAAELGPTIARGRPGGALELFHRLAGMPDEAIAQARTSPYWAGAQAIEHTLAYDATCVGEGPPPAERLRAIAQPTLVATGGGMAFMEHAADAIAELVPGAERVTLEGQGHQVDPRALAPVLARFFSA